MNETSLLNNIFKLRAKKIDKYATEAEAIQMRVLTELDRRPPAPNGVRSTVTAPYAATKILRAMYRCRIMRV